jgi:hypothetical protein
MHVPLQIWSPAGQERAHAPLTQTFPAGQTVPHVPQFAGSELRFVHVPAQFVSPLWQESWQVPPEHT